MFGVPIASVVTDTQNVRCNGTAIGLSADATANLRVNTLTIYKY